MSDLPQVKPSDFIYVGMLPRDTEKALLNVKCTGATNKNV